MRNFGLNKLADEFELSLNRLAEAARHQGTNIIVDTIKNMTAIGGGATDYLK